MKKMLLISLLAFFATTSFRMASPVSKDCGCNGVKLYGKVKVVTGYADVKVKIRNSYPDLKVKTVTSYPGNCGEWQFVDSYPDFTIQFVESYPDFTIRFVNSYPGIP